MNNDESEKCCLELNSEEYCTRFLARQRLPDNVELKGIVGRFIRGKRLSDFEYLSDDTYKKLSWVCSEELLGELLGKSNVECMIAIGKSISWLKNRLLDNTLHALVVFPSQEGTIATWEGVFSLVRLHYGEIIADKISTYESIISNGVDFSDLKNGNELRRISELPVEEKIKHPGFMSEEKFLSIESPTLEDCRGFLYHTIGCNELFCGTGKTKEGFTEMLIPNKRISDITHAVIIPINITEEELNQYAKF